MKYFWCISVLAWAVCSIRAQSSAQELVDIREWVPDIQQEVYYATPSNFLHRKMYAQGRTHVFLALGALKDLKKARADFQSQGYDIKIWDGYRPRSVQYEMWKILPNPIYVANPANGSSHNRGGAVDVTLVDLATGIELDMGTSFDDFSQVASHNYQDLPKEVLDRRALMRSIFDYYDYSSYSAEWWHYSWGAQSLPLYDFQIR